MKAGNKKQRDDIIKIEGETSLLIEIEDIRDELNIISMILREQDSVTDSLVSSLSEETSDSGNPGSSEAYNSWKGIVRQSVKRQINDVLKMEEQAKRAYNTVVSLLYHLCDALIISAHICRRPQVKASQCI